MLYKKLNLIRKINIRHWNVYKKRLGPLRRSSRRLDKMSKQNSPRKIDGQLFRVRTRLHRTGIHLFSVLFYFFLVTAPLLVDPFSVADAGGFFDTFGADARGMALGGAMSSIARGWGSVYYNPAALALSEDIELSLGLYYSKPSLTLKRLHSPEEQQEQFPGQDSGLDAVSGPVFGFLLPLQRCTPKRLPEPWAIGAGFFLPRQMLVTNRIIETEYPVDFIFNERNSTLSCQFGISTRITSALYLGVGFATQMVTKGQLNHIDAALLTLETETGLSTPSLLAGLLVRPGERIRLGFVYRQENKLRSRWRLDFKTRFGIPYGDDPHEILVIFDRALSQGHDYVSGYSPESMAVGGAYAITERLKLCAEMTWFKWSMYKGIFDQSLDHEFNDIIVPRIGVSYRITRKLEARCGFYFEPTPIPAEEEYERFGADRLVPSVGFGYSLTMPWGILANPVQLDAYFQYHIFEEKTHSRAEPYNPYLYSPDFTTKGHAINFGLSATFCF